MLFRFCLPRALVAGVLSSLMMLSAGPSAYGAEPDHLATLDLSQPNTKPAYPALARVRGETGTAIIVVHVVTAGKPDSVGLGKTSGFADLDQAALDAVRNWQFLPAVKDGVEIADWAALGVQFDLNDASGTSVAADDNFAQLERIRIVCKEAAGQTGTHLRTPPVCRTQAQWDTDRRRQQHAIMRALDNPNTSITP